MGMAEGEGSPRRQWSGRHGRDLEHGDHWSTLIPKVRCPAASGQTNADDVGHKSQTGAHTRKGRVENCPKGAPLYRGGGGAGKGPLVSGALTLAVFLAKIFCNLFHQKGGGANDHFSTPPHTTPPPPSLGAIFHPPSAPPPVYIEASSNIRMGAQATASLCCSVHPDTHGRGMRHARRKGVCHDGQHTPCDGRASCKGTGAMVLGMVIGW